MKISSSNLSNVFRIIFIVVVFAFSVNQAKASPLPQYTVPSNINVRMFALNSNGSIQNIPDPECRNNNVATRNAYGCGTVTITYPYSTNTMSVNLESGYLPFVIRQEMGNNALLDALKAQAIAARSYALHLVEFSVLNNSTSHQVFTPYSVTPSSIHYQAVNETRGMIMICDHDTDCEPQRRYYPAFAQHSAGHAGDFTTAWTSTNPPHGYLSRVYDPIHTQQNGGHGQGMSQDGARNWARGVSETDAPYPPWDLSNYGREYTT